VDKIKGGIPNKQGRPFHSGNKEAKNGSVEFLKNIPLFTSG
jgi:hypothetical protein